MINIFTLVYLPPDASTVRLHDTQENLIIGLIRLLLDYSDACIRFGLTKIKSNRVTHSRIKTPRLFD